MKLCGIFLTTVSSIVSIMGWTSIAVAAPITWTTIDSPNNAASGTGQGSVANTYRMSTYEVTNSQYAEFLSSVAASDPYGLYNASMNSSPIGGIVRGGSSGNYTYSVKTGMADMPIVFVDYFDTLRFVNWLHNDKASNGTESGAYTLLGGTAVPSNGATITRNPSAKVWMPTIDEWYKAAFYDPRTTAEGGPPGDSHYWIYATGFNTLPANPGDPTGQANPNGVNWRAANVYAVTGTNVLDTNQNYLTNVGAYINSASPFGTFDQNGNVWEWIETNTGLAIMAGGAWESPFDVYLMSNNANVILGGFPLTSADNRIGFRVASSIPEPGLNVAVLMCALPWLLRRRPMAI